MDRHNWYYRFKPDVQWLEDFIEDIENADRNMLLALTVERGVSSGFVVTENDAGQDFSVDITAGVAYDPVGRRVYSSGAINLPFDEDYLGNPISAGSAGQSRVVSIYAHYSLVDDAGTAVVDGNGDTAYTESNEEVEFRLVQGTAATTGTEVPAADPGNNGVLLANVTITNGDTTIANADIDEDVKYILIGGSDTLTHTRNTYVHTQGAANTTWTINHNLDDVDQIVQVVDDSGVDVLPDSITRGANTTTIVFSSAQDGRAIIIAVSA